MSGFKQILMLVLGALVVVFAAVNQQPTPINLFLWRVAVPTSLLILCVLLAGILVGWLGSSQRRRRRQRVASPPRPAEPGETPPGPAEAGGLRDPDASGSD